MQSSARQPRLPAKTCEESDVTSRYWRRRAKKYEHAGVTSAWKRRIRRREREEGRQQARADRAEL